jgi:hypothetical protein
MGETLYDFILSYFSTLPHAVGLQPQQVVSAALSHMSMVVAYFSITATLLWFTTKSVLMRRTPIIYMFAAFIFLCGMGHFGHLIGEYPIWFQLPLDFLSGIVSLVTAFVLFQKRHFILSIVYQFKYVVGLLKTLEKLDEVDRP